MSQAINSRRRARKLALQSLYQWLMAGGNITDIEAQYRAMNNMEKIDTTYYCRLLHGVPAMLNEIESALEPFLDRPLASLNPIELTILRICSFELMTCPEIPYRVVLDESVALARTFGSQDGHRYVNGVLHNLAQKVREIEVNHERKSKGQSD